MTDHSRDDGVRRTTGGCLCGAVRFEIRGPLRAVTVCHGTMCRRAGTSVGAYNTACAPADLSITGEAPAWYVSSRAARRGFCPTCGSHLFWEPAQGDHVSVSAGAIDDQRRLSRMVWILPHHPACLLRERSRVAWDNPRNSA